MANPVLVEVTRSGRVESRHRAAVAVVDADGAATLTFGDAERPVYPRSAVKALQLLPLVESGIADRLGLTDAELALASASHGGEPLHVATAAAMLAKAGKSEACLECGSHWPLSETAARALAAAGREPGPLHNNCSGKHAGFICLACGLGVDPGGYIGPEHRVQELVRVALEDLTGASHGGDNRGIDGCSIPTYAVPLLALAYGFARFGTGLGIAGRCAAAAERIRAAVAANPFMLAGTGRFDTRITEVFGSRVFIKTGAEGVHGAALPELGLGIAVKCDDGGKRAAEVVMAAMIARLLPLTGDEAALIGELTRPVLRNWNGIETGLIEPAGPLAEASRSPPRRGS